MQRMTDPAATLQALADHYRLAAAAWVRYPDNPASMWLALAGHAEGIARRHTRHTLHAFGDPAREVVLDECSWCGTDWPCPDVAGLLAVAAAAGITLSTNS